MPFIKKHRIILIILLVATSLRLLMLGTVPNGFFRDEAAKGYNAYTLYHTGKDIDGCSFPLFTRELSTYNSALYTYLIIPFIPIVGLNEWSVRLPAALVGILTILLLYLFLLRCYGQTTAFIGSFFLAVSPWHLIFSRWANQGIMVPFLLTLFLYAFHRYLESKREDTPRTNGMMWSLLAWSVLGLSIYTYEVMKVFLPLFMITVIFIYRYQLLKDKKTTVLSLLLFFIIIIPALVYNFQSVQLSQSRFNRISILSLNLSYFETFLVFLKNYLSHYSPLFLFITGDHNPRHTFPSSGMMYWFDLPLLLMGLYSLWKKRNSLSYLLLIWFLIFPIPASLTIEGIPHALRAITALPVICIINALGLAQCVEMIKSKYLKQDIKWILILSSLVFVLVFTVVFQVSAYFHDTKSPRYFQYGMKETVEWTLQHQQPDQIVIVSPSLEYPEIFFQFYSHLNLQQLQNKGILFHTTYDQLQAYLNTATPAKPVLLILAPGELNELNPTKVITSPDGYPTQKIVVHTKS
jgi:4-amino-4-deoxy-L-arabinose transferase-like glycosyltransferase